jgi:hypothetical protein
MGRAGTTRADLVRESPARAPALTTRRGHVPSPKVVLGRPDRREAEPLRLDARGRLVVGARPVGLAGRSCAEVEAESHRWRRKWQPALASRVRTIRRPRSRPRGRRARLARQRRRGVPGHRRRYCPPAGTRAERVAERRRPGEVGVGDPAAAFRAQRGALTAVRHSARPSASIATDMVPRGARARSRQGRYKAAISPFSPRRTTSRSTRSRPPRRGLEEHGAGRVLTGVDGRGRVQVDDVQVAGGQGWSRSSPGDDHLKSVGNTLVVRALRRLGCLRRDALPHRRSSRSPILGEPADELRPPPPSPGGSRSGLASFRTGRRTGA